MSLYCIDEGLRGVAGKAKATRLRRARATTPIGPSRLELENQALKIELRRRTQEKPHTPDLSRLTNKLERPLNLLRDLEQQSRECSMRADSVDDLLADLEAAIKVSPSAALEALEDLRFALLSVHYQSESASLQTRQLTEENAALRIELDTLRRCYEEAVGQQYSRDSLLVCALIQERVAAVERGLGRDEIATFAQVSLPECPEQKAVLGVLQSLLQLARTMQGYVRTIQHLSNEVVQLRGLDQANCSADTVELFRT